MLLSISLRKFICKDKMNGVQKSSTPKILIFKNRDITVFFD